QRAADRYPLALAAGELARPSREQMADVEQLGDALALRRIEGKAAHAPAVIEVGGDAEMREQAPLLEDVTDAPSMRRHVDAALRIEQRGFVEDDVSAVRRDQSGDHAGERGLARAGRAEQRGHAT